MKEHNTRNTFWQTKTDRNLTQEDLRQITENLTGFFNILTEWQRKEHDNVH